MLYSLLAADVDHYRSVSIGEAALYALLGFAVVFLGISFLILVVWLVGKVMTAVQGKKTKKKEEPAPTSLVAQSEEELSEETVAVIMAALTAYYQTNNPKCEFTVKRIKRL